MISTALAAEILRLLYVERRSQREVAQIVGVSRVTVNRVASGEWAGYRRTVLSTATWHQPHPEPARRCPGCGGMVYLWPCLSCRLRASHERERESLAKGLVMMVRETIENEVYGLVSYAPLSPTCLYAGVASVSSATP